MYTVKDFFLMRNINNRAVVLGDQSSFIYLTQTKRLAISSGS